MTDEQRVSFPRDGGCFGCSPSNEHGMQLTFFRRGDRVGTRYAIPDRFHGAPGIAHGGIVATIFDEVSCGVVVFLKNRYVVTGELTVRYEAPCPVETELELVGWVEDDSHPRYCVVHAEAILDGQAIARSKGRFFYAELDQPAP